MSEISTIVNRTRLAQGLPQRVEDAGTLEKIVTLADLSVSDTRKRKEEAYDYKNGNALVA